jgi:hypothetical protein
MLAVEIAASDERQDAEPPRREQAKWSQHRIVQISGTHSEPKHDTELFVVKRLPLDRWLGVVRPSVLAALEWIAQIVFAKRVADDRLYILDIANPASF